MRVESFHIIARGVQRGPRRFIIGAGGRVGRQHHLLALECQFGLYQGCCPCGPLRPKCINSGLRCTKCLLLGLGVDVSDRVACADRLTKRYMKPCDLPGNLHADID